MQVPIRDVRLRPRADTASDLKQTCLVSGDAMDVKPQTTSQVRAALRELAAKRPGSASELGRVQRGSLLLRLHIQSHGLGTEMPEIAWHFLSDADIRYRSPDYGVAQTEGLLSALDLWQQQEER